MISFRVRRERIISFLCYYNITLAAFPYGSGEKADRAHVCREAFERDVGNLAALAGRIRGAERGPFEMLPCGVSRHEFRKGGKSFAFYLNTKNETVAVPGRAVTLASHELREVPAILGT